MVAFHRAKVFYLKSDFPEQMGVRSIVSFIAGIGLLGLVFWGAFSLWQDYREYRQFAGDKAEAAQRLDVLQHQLGERREALERLKSDKEYVELMIRRRLGYAKPEEKVFRFEE